MLKHLKTICTAVLSMIVYVLLLPYIIVRMLLLKLIWPIALQPMCVALLYPFSNFIHGQDFSLQTKKSKVKTERKTQKTGRKEISKKLNITSFSRTLIRGRAQWIAVIVLGIVWIIMHYTAAPLLVAQWGIAPQMIYLSSAVLVFLIAWGIQSWFNRKTGNDTCRQIFFKQARRAKLKPENKVILVCLVPLDARQAQKQLEHNEYAAVFYIDIDKIHYPPKCSFTKKQEYHKQLIAKMMQVAHELRREEPLQYEVVEVKASCVKSSPLISALAKFEDSETGQKDLKKTAVIFEHPVNSWFALLFGNPDLLKKELIEEYYELNGRFFTKHFFDEKVTHNYRLNINQDRLSEQTGINPIDKLIERLEELQEDLKGAKNTKTYPETLTKALNQLIVDIKKGLNSNDPIKVQSDIKPYLLTIVSLIQAELDAQTEVSPNAKIRIRLSLHLNWRLRALVWCSIGLIFDVIIFLILELVLVPFLRCLDWVFYRPENKDMTEWLRDWIGQGLFMRFLNERLERYPDAPYARTGLYNATVPKESSVVGALFPHQTLGSDIRSWIQSMPHTLRLWYFNGLVALSLACVSVPSIIAVMSLCGVTLMPSALFVVLGVPVSQSMCVIALTLILCVTHRVYNMMKCANLSSAQHDEMCPTDSSEVMQAVVRARTWQDPDAMNIHLVPPSRQARQQVSEASTKHFASSFQPPDLSWV
jgi:hypothetical protein